MVRQRKVFLDWFLLAAATAAGCMAAPMIHAQPAAGAASEAFGPILTSQLPNLNAEAAKSGIQPKAIHLYRRALRELHHGKAARAEKDAERAADLEPNFAGAEALAATAALAQRQLVRARAEAQRAARIDPKGVAAWVVLATADNYLARYAEAAAALNSMPPQGRERWQASYQWARAEAGQDHAAETLQWANRAALTAPPGFAPLHLLRASALLAAGQYRQAADELAIYLQLLGSQAPQSEALMRELSRIRGLQKSHAEADTIAEYRALAN